MIFENPMKVRIIEEDSGERVPRPQPIESRDPEPHRFLELLPEKQSDFEHLKTITSSSAKSLTT